MDICLSLKECDNEDLIKKNKKRKPLGSITLRVTLSPKTKEEMNEVLQALMRESFCFFLLFLANLANKILTCLCPLADVGVDLPRPTSRWALLGGQDGTQEVTDAPIARPFRVRKTHTTLTPVLTIMYRVTQFNSVSFRSFGNA